MDSSRKVSSQREDRRIKNLRCPNLVLPRAQNQYRDLRISLIIICTREKASFSKEYLDFGQGHS